MKFFILYTLFNLNRTVVKMFVVMYVVSDIPPNHRTFLRQRIIYAPLTNTYTNNTSSNQKDDLLKSYLRYLIHLRYIYIYIYFNGNFCKNSLFNSFKKKHIDFQRQSQAKCICTQTSN